MPLGLLLAPADPTATVLWHAAALSAGARPVPCPGSSLLMPSSLCASGCQWGRLVPVAATSGPPVHSLVVSVTRAIVADAAGGLSFRRRFCFQRGLAETTRL